MKTFLSFLTFPRFQYKCENRKLRNLENFQPPQKNNFLKIFFVLKRFSSFLSIRFQCKGENQNRAKMRNFELPQTSQFLSNLQVLKKLPRSPCFWFQCKCQNGELRTQKQRNLGRNLRNSKCVRFLGIDFDVYTVMET